MKTRNDNLQLLETVSDAFKGEYFFGIEQILDELDDDPHNTEKRPCQEPDWFGVATYML